MKCDICKEEITDVAYVELTTMIVKQNPDNQEPIVFQSPAVRSYYNARLKMHDRCFISLVGTNTKLDLKGGLEVIPVNQ